MSCQITQTEEIRKPHGYLIIGMTARFFFLDDNTSPVMVFAGAVKMDSGKFIVWRTLQKHPEYEILDEYRMPLSLETFRTVCEPTK